MKSRYGYILTLLLIFALGLDSLAQERSLDGISVRLAEYEALCQECLELKAKAAAGEHVSRNEAQCLLDKFVSVNKELKEVEQDMTVVQRRRFVAIGQWFSTGELPHEPQEAVLPKAPTLADSLTGPPAAPLTIQHVSSSPKVRNTLHLLVDISMPDFSYGIMAGYKYEHIGGYLRFRSNFHELPSVSYECKSDGSLPDSGKIWTSGASTISNLFVTAGVLVPVRPALSAYAGVGYGHRIYVWEDIDGSWALVSDRSHRGLAADAGLIFSWQRLAFHAGVTTISFKTVAFTCGIGVRL